MEEIMPQQHLNTLLPKAPRKDTHNGEYSSLEVRLGKEE